MKLMCAPVLCSIRRLNYICLAYFYNKGFSRKKSPVGILTSRPKKKRSVPSFGDPRWPSFEDKSFFFFLTFFLGYPFIKNRQIRYYRFVVYIFWKNRHIYNPSDTRPTIFFIHTDHLKCTF